MYCLLHVSLQTLHTTYYAASPTKHDDKTLTLSYYVIGKRSFVVRRHLTLTKGFIADGTLTKGAAESS